MIDDGRFRRFLELSAELTAFKEFELLGTGVAEDYMKTVEEIAGVATLDAMLDIHANLPEGRAGALDRKGIVSRELLGNDHVGPVARNLIKLWYTGTWNRLPSAWGERYGPAPRDRTFVVSTAAYIEGLMWKAIGAHPAGAKGPGYGSWQHPPKIPDFDGDPARPPVPNSSHLNLI
jgi:hypothetical protein